MKRGHIMGLILGDGQKMLDIVEMLGPNDGKQQIKLETKQFATFSTHQEVVGSSSCISLVMMKGYEPSVIVNPQKYSAETFSKDSCKGV